MVQPRTVQKYKKVLFPKGETAKVRELENSGLLKIKCD
jgi:hypothetical protein